MTDEPRKRGRPRKYPPPVDNAHVAPGCEQFTETVTLSPKAPWLHAAPLKYTPEEMAHRATEYDIATDRNVRIEFLNDLRAILAPLLLVNAPYTASDAVLLRNAETIRSGVAKAVELIEAELG